MRYSTTLLLLASLTGCNGGGAQTSTSTSTNTTTTTTYSTYFAPGCITVDGQGGYALLADAIFVADEGATIQLCGDPVEESVEVINKSVTIVGQQTLWEAPTNTPPVIASTGSSVTISDVSLVTTKAGAEAEDGAFLSLTNVDIEFASGFGTYGITSTDSALELSNVSIIAAPWTGIKVSGGELIADHLYIEGATAYGINLNSSAIASVSTSEIYNTYYTDDGSGSIFDGVGINVSDGATLTTDGNIYMDNIFASVYAEGADADLNNDYSDNKLGQYYGIVGDAGTLSVSNSDVANAYQWGIAMVTGDLILNQTTVTTSPKNSFTSARDKDGNITLGSMGVVMLGSDLTMTGGTVSGFNSAGLWAEPSGIQSNIDVDGALITDNAERGIFITDGDLIATKTTISYTTNNDDVCIDPSTGSMSCNMAMFAIDSSVEFGGSIINNDDWGLTVLNSSLVIDGGYVAENKTFGVFGQQSSVTVLNTTFEKGGDASFYLYDSSAVVQNSVFQDPNDYIYENWDGKGGWIEYAYESNDIYAYVSSVTVEDSTFLNSDYAVYANEADATMRRCNLDNVNRSIYSYYGSMVEIIDSNFTNVGAQTLYAYEGDYYIQDTTFDTIHPYQYGYTYYYADGSIYTSYDYDSNGPIIYSYYGSVEIEDVEVNDSNEEVVYLYEGDLKIDGLEISGISSAAYSQGAITMYNSSQAPDAELSDIAIDDVGYGDAIDITNYYKDHGLITIEDLSIGIVNEAGIGIDQMGLDIYGAEVTIEGLDMANIGTNGIDLSYAVANITGNAGANSGTIQGTGTYGIYSLSSDVTVSDLTISDAGYSGWYVSGGTHEVSDLTIINANYYGMECSSSPEFGSCSATLDGLLGETNGACNQCEGF